MSQADNEYENGRQVRDVANVAQEQRMLGVHNNSGVLSQPNGADKNHGVVMG